MLLTDSGIRLAESISFFSFCFVLMAEFLGFYFSLAFYASVVIGFLAMVFSEVFKDFRLKCYFDWQTMIFSE